MDKVYNVVECGFITEDIATKRILEVNIAAHWEWTANENTSK